MTARRLRRGLAGRPPWLRALVYTAGVLALIGAATLIYSSIVFSRLIDARLHGERERTLPRVYARPVELRVGQSFSVQDLVGRLNDLGYAQRARPETPGEFAIGRTVVVLTPRRDGLAGREVRVSFPLPPPVRRAGAPAPPLPRGIQAIEVVGRGHVDSLQLDSPLLTALMTSGGREKRRSVPLATIPTYMQQAVLAIEDQGFYSHPGINPVRIVAALLTNVFGRNPHVVGYSTITQQLARMFFLADEFNTELQSGARGRTWTSYARKAREALMSLVLERRASKDEILELYLNDIYLGQRGSFAIHGVAEAARLFFGKDVANVSLSEAALIAGVIQNPSRSPFASPERALERRNVVLRAMADEGYISEDAAERAMREPLQVVARAVDNEAPYFVDMVSERMAEAFPGVTAQTGRVDVFTTLDLNLQRAALDAVRAGLASVDQLLSRRRRPQRAQAALIAVDPRTGEILAMVGGRSYNQSQYNRAIAARRQPGSVFKPFVYLAALERGAEEGRIDLTPAALTLDEPASFTFDDQVWEPRNYDAYDGEITWRRALAMSRNLGTIHVGETIGFDRVAALWRRVGVGTPPRAFPSITLGVFELTPLEVAQAYTLFLNGGRVRPLRAIRQIETDEGDLRPTDPPLKTVARPDTTFLVTNMMRSVMDEGTGAGARAAGFTLAAAGKTGTTNDLRDAWFVGFTPELLTVVWVGFDDNQPIGLSGSRAALPVWTAFMKDALAGRPNLPFEVPEGVSFAEIDRDTGRLALPGCPRTYHESFIAGTEPVEYCELHRW
ncbi:MAG: transglycosylase domain-containing protein [Acidobacteria bacterium]|nr:transglycosylase domain-containing protein [Acidobacteriota bacterium]